MSHAEEVRALEAAKAAASVAFVATSSYQDGDALVVSLLGGAGEVLEVIRANGAGEVLP